MNTDIPLILFAKVPEIGKVKTRLTPDMSLTEATEVAKVLLDESLSLAKVWPGNVVLAVWPNLENHFIQKMSSRYHVDTIQQVKGDLGQKMFVAMETVGYPSAVMGCDAPHCSQQNLLTAYEKLSTGENVIGPTFDGGYYLLGLQHSIPELFKRTRWGGHEVLTKSLSNAKNQGLSFSFLEKISDIDTYEDLVEASKKLDVLKSFVK